MKLKKFLEFFSSVTEDNGYPAGVQYDPRAPWKQKDPEMFRGEQIKQSDIKFKLVAWDGEEFAMFKEISTDKLYLLYVDTTDEDFRGFVEIPREYLGNDGEDADYEYGEFDPTYIDDLALESYATQVAKDKGLGRGMIGFEEGKLSEIDQDLAKDVYETLTFHLEKLEKNPRANSMMYRTEKIEPVTKFLEILSQKI